MPEYLQFYYVAGKIPVGASRVGYWILSFVYFNWIL